MFVCMRICLGSVFSINISNGFIEKKVQQISSTHLMLSVSCVYDSCPFFSLLFPYFPFSPFFSAVATIVASGNLLWP